MSRCEQILSHMMRNYMCFVVTRFYETTWQASALFNTLYLEMTEPNVHWWVHAENRRLGTAYRAIKKSNFSIMRHSVYEKVNVILAKCIKSHLVKKFASSRGFLFHQNWAPNIKLRLKTITKNKDFLIRSLVCQNL